MRPRPPYIEESPGDVVTARAAKHKKIAIGATKLTLVAGQKRTVTVSLNSAGKRLPDKHRHFMALLEVKFAGKAIKTQKLPIKRRRR